VTGKRLLIALAVLTAVLSWPGPEARGETAAAPTEYQVKAAFLYSFAKFVQWPDDAFSKPEEPFVVGVLGDDPFGSVLDDTLAGKTVLNRPVVIKRFGKVEDVRAQILFVGSSERRDLPRVLKSLRGRAILSAGETEDFAENGGIVGFKTKDRRVRFEINLSRAEEARLRISSQLLKLATIVSSRS
jgi:uncharacterized protein DUF4154